MLVGNAAHMLDKARLEVDKLHHDCMQTPKEVLAAAKEIALPH
jgi:hypothetical protein